jgi:serine/threonine protein kinase
MAERFDLCDETRLAMLLTGDERCGEYRELAAHVETCHACQQRLTELAGDVQSWNEVRELLSSADGEGAAPGQTNRSASGGFSAQRQVNLDFLSPPSHPELLGRLGRYEIERLIGTGGMGVVLRGFDTELNRPVAIKVLAPYLAHNAAARQRFAREGRAAAAVVHEHVVAIYNVEAEGEVPFLVMQYVAGESLQDRVERRGPLDAKEILRIGIQTAAGLAAAHQHGLVHRDVKPANILLETGVERVLLTDFGLARAIDDASLTHTGLVAGTPQYMSPEQANGQPVDYRSDLFSLGSVLYFMATGHPPFRAERPMAVLHRICHDRHRPVREINFDLPDDLSAMIDRLLDKRPRRRPGSAAEVQQALAAILSDLQQGRTGRRRTRRWRRVLAAATIAGGLVVTAIAVLRTSLHPAPTGQPTVRLPVGNAEPWPKAVPSSPGYIAESLSVGPSPQQDFAAEFVSLVADLDRLDTPGASRDLFLHQRDQVWHSELEAARQNLTQLENLPFSDFRPQRAEP